MQQRSMIAEAESYLRTQLAGGPQPVSVLVKGTAITARTLRRAGQNLGITRSRNGENGFWIWSLPIEPEYLPLPVAEAEPPAPEAPSANAYTVDQMLALAEQGGLHYPLIVTVKNPAPVDVAHKWSSRVFSAPGVVERTILKDFIPDDGAAYEYITVRESQPPVRVNGIRVGGIFAPGPWSLVLEHGKLSWRDWRWRRPKPSAQARRRKET
jgi:hypothetical protein